MFFERSQSSNEGQKKKPNLLLNVLKTENKFSHKINKAKPKRKTEFGKKKKYEKFAITHIVVYSRYGRRKVEILKP